MPGRRKPSLVGQQPVSDSLHCFLQVSRQVGTSDIAERYVAAGVIQEILQRGVVDTNFQGMGGVLVPHRVRAVVKRIAALQSC